MQQSPSADRSEQDEKTQRGEPGSSCCCPGDRSERQGDSGWCCPPAPDDSGGGNSGGSRGRTYLFLAVMLIAVGVGGYSFSKKYVARSQDQVQALKASTGNLAANDPASGGAVAACGITLSSLEALGEAAVGKEAVFVLLPGEGEESSRTASRQVNAVVEMLSEQGREIAAFTLQKHREGHGQLMRQMSVRSLPCVVVAGRGCGSVAVSGDITKLKLLQAFVQASTLPSACGAASKGSCCPK